MFLSPNQGTDQRFYFSTYNGKWDMGIQNSGWGGSGSINVDLNKWSHIEIVTTGSVAYMYVNGKITSQKNYTSFTFPENLYIGIHGSSGAYGFVGYIDDVKIYPYTRSTDQIKQDYNSRGSSKGTTTNLGGAGSDNNLSEGLVGYWKMDEGSGTTTADSSGNSNTGTFGTGSSAPSWSSGKFGIGTSYLGNNYIEISDISKLPTGNNPRTMSLFFKTTQNGAHILSYGTQASNQISALGFYNNNLGYLGNGSDLTTPSTGYYDGNWHQITMTFDGSTQILYIDGIQKNSRITILNTGTTKLRMGANCYPSIGEFFNGLIDEVRIYNRALSPAEVSQLYNYASGPVGYWDFEEKTGTIAKDKSGNNYSGTLGTGNSAPTWGLGKYGSGLNFNGNQYINLSNFANKGISSNLQNFTVSAFIKPTLINSNQKTIYAEGAGGSTAGSWAAISLINNEIRVHFKTYNTGDLILYDTSGANITANNTYHVSVTRNGNIITTYVDGIVRGTGTHSGASWGSYPPGISPSIGDHHCYADLNFFYGTIDDVKIYNYARTQKQIIEDMNGGAPAASTKSILAYYKFDEGSGTTANNSGNGGSALNGTLTGTTIPTWINNGQKNKALNFTNGYIQTPAITLNTSFTFSAWFNPSSFVDWAGVVTNLYHPAPASGLVIVPLSGSIRIAYGDGANGYSNYIVSNSQVTTNKWNYVALSYDGNNATLYLNGKQIDKRSITIAQTSRAIRMGIWASSYSDYLFNGYIDEVKIYNYALTDEEVKQDYNSNSALQMGQTSQTIGGTTTSLDYCIPGDTSYCASPVAEWKMDEKTGTTAKDISGNNNNGTISGATWTSGKIGAGLKFSGSSQYTTIEDSTSLKPTTAITTEAWFNTTDKSLNQRMLSKTSSGGYSLSINENSACVANTLCFLININGTYYSATYPSINLSNNTWYHVAGSYDGTTVRLFLNGSNIGTTALISNTISHNTAKLCIGSESASTNCYSESGFFSGKIDHVKIYNYARTPAQIAYDYNKGAPVGWWKFDDCQGLTAFDSSGLGNNATISIGPSGTQNSVGTCQAGTSAAWTNGATGKYNSSLNFDGIDDYIWLGNLATLSPSNLSISSWFKISSNITGTIIRNRTYGYSISLSSGNVRTHVYESSGSQLSISSPLTYGDNNWHFATSTYNGTTIRLYVDGKLVNSSTGTGTGTIYYSGNAIGIGRDADNSSSYFTGQIDDVRIYNYALTSEQIKTVYNNGAVNFN